MVAAPAEPDPEDRPPPRDEELTGNGPDRNRPDRASPGRNEPHRASPDRASPDRASPDRAHVPEALAAGFTHRDPGHHGAGFAAGGAADAMPPGSQLARLTEQTWADGLGSVDDDELAGLLCAYRRLSSWAAAGEMATVTEFARRRTAAGLRAIEHLDDEIAALLTLTWRSAARLTGIAASLARLPRTTAALRTGQIDMPRATVIADDTCCLSDADAAAVEERVLPAAPGQTTGQLRAAVRRAMLAIDAEAAIKRRKKAEKDARVETWTEASGTCALAARDLPPADVIAADKHIDGLARWLKANSAEGTLDQLRAKVCIALLAGRGPETLLPVGTSLASKLPLAPGLSPAPGVSPALGFSPASTFSGPSGWPTGLGGSVNLTMPLTTWLGLTTDPGEAAGLGPLDADACRDLAAALASNPGSRWCLTLTGPDGRAAAHGCARSGPGSPDNRLSDPGPPGSGPPDAGPSEPRPRAGPPGTRPAGTPPPRPTGTRPPCAQSPGRRPTGTRPPCAHSPGTRPTGTRPPCAHSPGTRPTGTRPPCAHSPGTRPTGTEPPRGGRRDRDLGNWLAAIQLAFLETGTCTHSRETSAYRPCPALRHLINIRDRTCFFPPCRRPAVKCDQDHTVPFDQGGRSCECNLGPGCRRHHRAKQAPGWHVEQTEPGRFTWSLPNGRQLTTVPGCYPA